MTPSPHRVSLALVALALAACTGSSAGGGGTGGGATTATIADPPGPVGCSRGVIEADFKALGPLAGSGVDPATHALSPLPATAVVSSTYLALHADQASQQLFGSLLQPVLAALAGAPGLLGSALGTSASCGTARTLTVWKDEASMVAFATGAAHAAAAARIADVSRGGSVVTSWPSTSAGDATWEAAARELAALEGTSY